MSGEPRPTGSRKKKKNERDIVKQRYVLYPEGRDKTRGRSSRKQRRPVQEQWARTVSVRGRGRGAAATTEERLLTVCQYDACPPMVFDKHFKLQHGRHRNAGEEILDYFERCYVYDGDALADFDNGCLDAPPPPVALDAELEALEMYRAWELHPEPLPECYRHLPRVIGCIKGNRTQQDWLREKIRNCLPASWSLSYAQTYSGFRSHPVLGAPGGPLFEVHPVLAKMRRIGLMERRKPIFQPLSITTVWYPPSPKRSWMAPWSPKLRHALRDRRSPLSGFWLFKSSGVVLVEGKRKSTIHRFDVRNLDQRYQHEVVYGFDFRAERTPVFEATDHVLFDAAIPLSLLKGVRLLHMRTDTEFDDPPNQGHTLTAFPKIVLEWYIDGGEGSTKRFTVMVAAHANLRHTVCKEFSFVLDYPEPTVRAAEEAGALVQLRVLLIDWYPCFFERCTIRFLTAAGHASHCPNVGF